MRRVKSEQVSRRDFLRLTAAAAAAGPLLLRAGRAAPPKPLKRTLKIAKWSHFLPEYDAWFAGVLAKEWGERHDVEVVVDHFPAEEIKARAAAEAAAGNGHDIFMFPWPPAEFHRHVIDHAEIYQAVSFRHGSLDRLGHKSTFDPKTRKYFAFTDFWTPAPLHYYADQWAAVNMRLGPLHYGSLRSGGRRLRDKLGMPSGLALTPSLEGNITLHALLYAFGAHVLDADGAVLINRGARTVAALRYVKALHEEAGAPEQLAWGSGGNALAMLAGKSSCTINAISLLRTAEKEAAEKAGRIRLSPPLLGAAGIVAVPHATNCSVVWRFAENRDGAKQFLSDLIDSSKSIYEQSRGANFPIYQKTVPDLIVRLENDPYGGDPSYKYKELKDALHWTTNVGFPGFASPAVMEAFTTLAIPRMFLSVVKGEASPEEAARAAEAELQLIANKWKQG